MARHIVVADDIYLRLKALKKPGESFSNVIRRLIEEADATMPARVPASTS